MYEINDRRRRQLIKNYLWRRKYINDELYRYIYEGVKINPYQSLEFRGWVTMYITSNFFNNSRSKVKSICVYSGRRRGMISYWHLNRCSIYEFLRNGRLAGLRSISW